MRTRYAKPITANISFTMVSRLRSAGCSKVQYLSAARFTRWVAKEMLHLRNLRLIHFLLAGIMSFEDVRILITDTTLDSSEPQTAPTL